MTHVGEVFDGASGEDERHIGSQAEERVEGLCLIHRGDLCSTPHSLSC